MLKISGSAYSDLESQRENTLPVPVPAFGLGVSESTKACFYHFCSAAKPSTTKAVSTVTSVTGLPSRVSVRYVTARRRDYRTSDYELKPLARMRMCFVMLVIFNACQIRSTPTQSRTVLLVCMSGQHRRVTEIYL